MGSFPGGRIRLLAHPESSQRGRPRDPVVHPHGREPRGGAELHQRRCRLFATGENGSFTVTTGGEPAPALSREGALPAGLAFTDNGDGTATIAGTPDESAALPGGFQEYPLTLKAASGAGEASQPFTLTVHNGGETPAFTSAPTATFTTGMPASFTIEAGGDRLPRS